MKRENIKQLVDERLAEIGCPLTNRAVKIVPSKLCIEIAVGDQRLKFECPPGLPEDQVRARLAEFERKYLNHKNQIDLERAIADALPVAAE